MVTSLIVYLYKIRSPRAYLGAYRGKIGIRFLFLRSYRDPARFRDGQVFLLLVVKLFVRSDAAPLTGRREPNTDM